MQGNTRIPSLKNLLQTLVVLHFLWAVPAHQLLLPLGEEQGLRTDLARRKATPSSDILP